MVTDGAGRLLSGEPLSAAADELLPIEPDALGVNCVPARKLAGDLAALAAAAPGCRLAAYGNLGLPAEGPGWNFTDELDPEDYAREAARWLGLGARIVGGCCGTTPAHTRALRTALDAGRRAT
jgi:5-methyltetrahydrofolate--homocysteine methyltransferase